MTFVEPIGAYFQHFNTDGAEYIPTDPRDVDEWEAAGNVASPLSGYLKRDVVGEDDGQTSTPSVRLEFQGPTPAFEIERDHTLRIDTTLYRVRSAIERSGMTHIEVGIAK